MPARKIVRVWIEDGCIACDVCQTLCPDVFEVRGETCLIKPAARQTAFAGTHTDAILDAARDCPVEVIRYETTEIESLDEAPASARPLSRRGLLSSGSLAIAALGGSTAIAALATQRFMFPNVPAEADPTFAVGPIDRFANLPVNGVSDAAASHGIWIVRLSDRIAACSRTCTHLGCPTRWDATDGEFKCPCHGSVFLPDGTNVQGPAPRPLDRLAIHRRGDQIIVDRSRRFLKERGQWDDPDSYVRIQEGA